MPKKTIAWVSRHPPLPAQIRMLKAKLVTIDVITEPFTGGE